MWGSLELLLHCMTKSWWIVDKNCVRSLRIIRIWNENLLVGNTVQCPDKIDVVIVTEITPQSSVVSVKAELKRKEGLVQKTHALLCPKRWFKETWSSRDSTQRARPQTVFAPMLWSSWFEQVALKVWWLYACGFGQRVAAPTRLATP